MTEIEKLKGTVEFELDGEILTFCYTWDALIAVYSEWKDAEIKLDDPATLLEFARIGLEKFHPELTLDELRTKQPPVKPLLQAAQRAYLISYLGEDVEGLIQDTETMPSRSRLSQLFGGLWPSKNVPRRSIFIGHRLRFAHSR